MQINVSVTDANNILCEVVPPQPQIIVIDRGVEGNGIVSIVPVTISTFQYLRITYTNGTVQDVGPLTSTAYTATAPITIVGNTISLATVPIASGGTDATTAAGAIQNLLPSYTGNANKRLGLNSLGTALEWVLDGGGTVTSVAASGGTTGLTFTGSPITTSGTLTLGGTLAVANGGTGVTSSTGTGSVVLSTSPTLVTPVLGTPTSGNFSTGTFTWPTFNQNTTGTAANITATSNSTLTTLSALSLPGSQVSGNISGNAANVTGVVAIANGGTGQTTANAALNALLPTQTGNASKYLQTDGTNATWDAISLSTADITGILPTANGGTGLSSFTANGVVYASSTSALTTGSALTFNGTSLGVGATTLNYRLEVGSTSDSTNSINIKTSTTGTSNLFFSDTNNGQGGITYNHTSDYMRFLVADAEQMRMTTTGLGIGTSSPAFKLDVVAASNSANTIAVRNTDTSTANYSTQAYFRIDVAGNHIGGLKSTAKSLGGLSTQALYLTTAGAYPIAFGLNDSATPSMVLDTTGTLFVNSTARPSGIGGGDNGKLWVKQTTTGNYGISSIASATDSFISIANNGTVGLIGTSYGSTGSYMPLAFYTSDLERARITASGDFGIGTSSPGTKLDVTGAIRSIVSGGTPIFYLNNGTTQHSIQNNSGSLAFYNDGTRGMDLTSTGLGIGTSSPANKLSVYAGGIVANFGAYGTGAYDDVELQAYSGYCAIGTRGSTPLVFNIARSEKMRLDTSGNLGLGVTPSAWSTGYKAIQLLTSSLYGTTSRDINLGANVYVDAVGYKYIQTSFATNYTQYQGAHSWYTAPSGTAGTAITFTQAMTLTNAGNLAIGQTSSALQSGGTGITLYGSSNSEIKFLNSSTGSAATDGTALLTTSLDFQINNRETGAILFGTSNSERARIDSSGNLLLGLSSALTNGKLQIAGGIGLSGNTQIRQATNGDGNTLQLFATQVVVGVNNGTSYSYTGGGLLASLANSASAITLDVGGTTAGHRLQVVNDGSGSTGTLNYSNAGTSRFYVNSSSGFVGIGSTSPSSILDVLGTPNRFTVNPSYYCSFSTGLNSYTKRLFGGAVVDDYSYIGDMYYENSGTWKTPQTSYAATTFGGGVTTFYGGTGVTANTAFFPIERARINSDGDLLIGATSQGYPASGYKLGIQSGGSQTFFAIAKSGQTLGSGGMILGIDSTGGALYVRENQPLDFYTNNAFRVRIDNSGNLLVGTTNVTGAGASVGQIVTNFNGAVQNGMYVSDTRTSAGTDNAINFGRGSTLVGRLDTTLTSLALTNLSDQRVKTNVQDSENALGLVGSVKVRQFDWTIDNSHEDFGFVAQELNEVLPQAVSVGKTEEEMWGVNFVKLVPILTKAIQEQQAIIESLKARLDAANL